MTQTCGCEKEVSLLAGEVAHKYGPLALARAAATASAAQRQGNEEASRLWFDVVSCLRLSLISTTRAAQTL